MGVMDDLTDAALDAFEDELRCWQRQGTYDPRLMRLVRRPSMPLRIDDVVPEVANIDYIVLPNEQIHGYVLRAAMEKAVAAVHAELHE